MQIFVLFFNTKTKSYFESSLNFQDKTSDQIMDFLPSNWVPVAKDEVQVYSLRCLPLTWLNSCLTATGVTLQQQVQYLL